MARGWVEIDIERCKGCELCLSACPPDVLRLAAFFNTSGYRPAVLYENGSDKTCTGCALCAMVCPEGSITVYRERTRSRAAAQGG